MENDNSRVHALDFALRYCPKLYDLDFVIKVATSFHDFLIGEDHPKIEPETPLVSFFKSLHTMDPVNGSISLIPYRYQIEALEAMDTNNRVILNKARQIGGTMLAVVYAAWFASQHPNSVITIVSGSYTAADTLRCRFIGMFSLKLQEINKHSVCFENGSRIRFTEVNKCGDISESDLFVLDEVAFFSHKHGYQCWTAISKSITTAGKHPDAAKIILISTPHVTDGIFFDIWANRDRNGFYGIELPHTVRASSIRPEDIAAENFEQEFNCKFKEVNRNEPDRR